MTKKINFTNKYKIRFIGYRHFYFLLIFPGREFQLIAYRRQPFLHLTGDELVSFQIPSLKYPILVFYSLLAAVVSLKPVLRIDIDKVKFQELRSLDYLL